MSVEKEFSSLYNDEDDILTVYDNKKKPSEFVEISDFISLGLNKDGTFNSIEISDASNFLSTINKEVDKDFLNKLKVAKIKQDVYKGVFLLLLILLTKEGQKVEQLLPPLFKTDYESPLLVALNH